ncbi:alginate O-acetyltransferase AlgX-related protein [Cupriavidus oxalaticus]|uniref:AlgX/AlgJ SGNH hydrolase-like domain-containing protein n=1 Tax=Cupriavidus oxalaticus TaxID=96344 RepID=A0A4P7LD43_9BURK|nr:hypothetical protein [Cupriavidus oxalaticus]QBY49681.1 hypothetical protein E0W60_00075 [Cupriavidus oxalaticus]
MTTQESGHSVGERLRTVKVRRLDFARHGIRRWALDAPANERLVDAGAAAILLQGWLLWDVPPDQPVHVVVARLDDAEARLLAFNCKRPDVIERVLLEQAVGHPQLCCGFAWRIPLPLEGFRLGIQVGQSLPVWLAEVEFVTPMQVIVGPENWLFLDNDTNRSVDQYTGKRLLDADELHRWSAYLAGCRTLATRVGARHALVLAPSKEEVLPHRYPYKRAHITVLDQVCTLAQPEDHVVNAAPVLAAHKPPEACFKVTDTHWSDRGAMLATLAALPHLGVDVAQARALFSHDAYEAVNEVGDLGCKLLPARSAPTEFLKCPVPEAGASFDNRLPNIGRTLVFENEGAVYQRRLLLFGASSSYPMLKYLKRLFQRVVFVHSAAQVDVRVVEHEQPNALLLQSNGRFLVQAPHLHFVLQHAMQTKLAEASPALRQHVRVLLDAAPTEGPNVLYHQMLAKATKN